MSSFAKAAILGRLGRDPEMRYTQTGRPFTTFSVACNYAYTGQDGVRHEETEWFRVTAWGKLAETCSQILSKGRLVYVDGRLRTRTWETQDGEKRFSVDIIANDMRVVDSPPRAEVGEPQLQAEEPSDLDNMPF